jgi:hypothetical protein
MVVRNVVGGEDTQERKRKRFESNAALKVHKSSATKYRAMGIASKGKIYVVLECNLACSEQ